MEEAPENGKESSHPAHANGMNKSQSCYMLTSGVTVTVGEEGGSVLCVRTHSCKHHSLQFSSNNCKTYVLIKSM